MHPFLLLQSRPEQAVADHEYQAFLDHGQLSEGQLVRVPMHEIQPDINLDDYAGVIMGGGPANFSTPDSQKPATQKAFEPWLFELLGRIISQDKPFLGTCLGLGALITYTGGSMQLAGGEQAGPVQASLTVDGMNDPLLRGLPQEFSVIVGHKEGALDAPEALTVLARSATCIQMVRAGHNVYATQFHPELTPEGLRYRLEAYKDAGYCDPNEINSLVTAAADANAIHAVNILRAFTTRYASDVSDLHKRQLSATPLGATLN